MRYWLHILFGHRWAKLDDQLRCVCWICNIVRWRE